jgi:hypothetical protein
VAIVRRDGAAEQCAQPIDDRNAQIATSVVDYYEPFPNCLE